MLAKNLQQFMMKQSISDRGINELVRPSEGPAPEYGEGYGSYQNIYKPVAPGHMGREDTYRTYTDPYTGDISSATPGETPEWINRETGRIRTPEEIDRLWEERGMVRVPRPAQTPEQLAAAEQRRLQPVIVDPSPTVQDSRWDNRLGGFIMRSNANAQAPDTEQGYTRIRDYGRDPGGNRILPHPGTGMEHWIPEGSETPQWYQDKRKRQNKVQTEKDIEEAGKFRLSDVWKNLWNSGEGPGDVPASPKAAPQATPQATPPSSPLPTSYNRFGPDHSAQPELDFQGNPMWETKTLPDGRQYRHYFQPPTTREYEQGRVGTQGHNWSSQIPQDWDTMNVEAQNAWKQQQRDLLK
jgi:hypothetical protein